MSDEGETENDVLAAEFAMRLLEGEELRAAEARWQEDPAFRHAVEGWTIRLAVLADDLPPERPVTASKQALLARLFPQRTSLWSGPRLWRGVALVALLLAAGLGWQVLTLSGPREGPLYTAAIMTETGDFRVVAVVDKLENQITLTRTAGAAPPGRILQVWAHGEGAPALSVGLWPASETVRLPLPAEIAAVEGILTVGVSEEPPGGSPTGSPSGRVFGTVDIPGVISHR